jgi:hypothetical protein
MAAGRQAAKFSSNVRALRGTVMGLGTGANVSTESDFYVDLPSGLNVQPVGVLAQDVVEPGYPLTSEVWLDPNSGNPVNGSVPPSPFSSQNKAWGVVTAEASDEQEFIAADATITAGCDLVIADAYGRVTNASAVAPGNNAYVVGSAKYPSSAPNQRIRGSVNIHVRKM